MERVSHLVQSGLSLDALPAAHVVSPDARIAAGKALRDKIAREQHGRLNIVKSGRDVTGMLRKSDAGRMRKLVPIRYGRMLQSPFAFYRGAAGIMAADI